MTFAEVSTTGREFSPRPKGKIGGRLLRRTHRWLIEEAIAEAVARRDGFNEITFRSDLAYLDGSKPQPFLPPASSESACLYLFGSEI